MHSRTLGLMAALVVGGLALGQSPAPVNNPALPPTAVAPPGVSAVPGGGPTYPTVPTFGAVPQGPSVYGPTALAEDSGPIVYAAADYILWQIRKGNIPATASTIPVGLLAVDVSNLVTTNPVLPGVPSGTPVTGYTPISIFNEATFGGGPHTNIGAQNGGRFTLGIWGDSDMSWGIEAQFAFLERGSDTFFATSSQQGNQFILDTGFTRTLFLISGTPPNVTQQPLSTFNVFVAREAVSSLVGHSASAFYTGEVNGRCIGYRVGPCDIGGLVGFRYVNFADELQLLNSVRLFAPPGIPLTQADLNSSLSRDLNYLTFDRTRIYNHFFGAQVGVDLDSTLGACFFNARIKGAVGNMHQVADVQSRTLLINNDPGRSPPGYTSEGGLLAAPGQNGRHTRNRVGFIPEVNLKVGYQFSTWLRGYVGYDALMLVNAARPGGSVVLNQLSTTVTTGGSTPINVNINQPTFRFRDQDIWVQGVCFGFEASY